MSVRPPLQETGRRPSRSEHRRSTRGDGTVGRLLAAAVLSGLCVYFIAFPMAAVAVGAVLATLALVVVVPLACIALHRTDATRLLPAGSVRSVPSEPATEVDS
jgi:Flp pilus assembly protein TadB